MKYLLTLLFFTCCSLAFGQEHNVFFFTKYDTRTPLKDSSYYIRVITPPDSGKIYFKVQDVYTNSGKLKFIGQALDSYADKLQGTCIKYYENGKRKSIQTYEEGKPSGEWYAYYESGILQKVENFFRPGNKDSIENTLITYNDTTGKAIVTNGNGYFEGYENRNFLKGQYNNGKKDGIWKGICPDGKTIFDQTFDKGRFVSGSTTNNKGKVYNYTRFGEIQPEFEGGMEKLYNLLVKKVTYNEDSKKNMHQGRLFVTFIINYDGSLTDIKILRSIDPFIDKEVMRALKKLPDWNPGIQNGIPVRVQFSMPVNFALN